MRLSGKRSILFILLLLSPLFIYLFFAPKTASAAIVIWDPLEFIINEVVLPLVRAIANSLENRLVNHVNRLITKIDGKSPAFITSWRDQILDSQGRGNDVFRAVLADTNFCSYFKDNIRTTFGADPMYAAALGAQGASKTGIPGLPSFQYSANCTLPLNFDVAAFQQDFVNGGWATWDKLVGEPQNTFLGAYAMALGEQSKQIEIDKQASQDSSVAGQGFLSQLSGAGGPSPEGCSAGMNGVARCIFLGRVLTPGDIIGTTAANTLDTKLKRIGGAQKIADILLGLFSAVIQGLSGNIFNYFSNAGGGGGNTQSFSEQQFSPGAGDPNFNPLINKVKNAGEQSCQNSCMKSAVTTCTIKAKKLTCDVAASGGSATASTPSGTGTGGPPPVVPPPPPIGGGTPPAGGGTSSSAQGGSSSANCTDAIDPAIYGPCISAEQTACDTQCAGIITPSLP